VGIWSNKRKHYKPVYKLLNLKSEGWMGVTALEQTKQGEPGALPGEPCSQGGPVGSGGAELCFILFALLSTFSMDAKGFRVSQLFTFYSSF